MIRSVKEGTPYYPLPPPLYDVPQIATCIYLWTDGGSRQHDMLPTYNVTAALLHMDFGIMYSTIQVCITHSRI